jgi:hypothetical protein
MEGLRLKSSIVAPTKIQIADSSIIRPGLGASFLSWKNSTVISPGSQINRPTIAVAFRMHRTAYKREPIAGSQEARLAFAGQPHLTFDDHRIRIEWMAMQRDSGIRFPASL